ncbi:MAG: hypothetical protein K2X81_03780, partial [Candidatus Obscuribacterales bacterium]|nr:hypothetical protein [Candidatus Obscuribacterales bacterium]
MAKSKFSPVATTLYFTKTCYLAIKKWARATMPGCPVKFLLNSFQGKSQKLLTKAQLKGQLPSLQDKDVQTMLSDLQGNILCAHGRFHAAHVFLQFLPGKEKEARNWIAFFAEHAITSAQRQFQGNNAYRKLKFDDGTFAHIALSNSGYSYLQVPDDKKPTPANPQKRGKEVAYTNVFAQGAKARQDELLDPAVSAWESGFQSDIHALVILGNDTKTQLEVSLQGLRNSVASFATICTIEYGETVNGMFEKDGNRFSATVEHFGYRDGKSQPLFFAEQLQQEEKEGGTKRYNPQAALSLVLVKDHLGTTALSFGSFLV